MKRLLLLVAGALLVFTPVHAEPTGMGMMGRGAGYGFMGMGGMDAMADNMGTCLANADKIGLTPDQVAKLTPLHREMQKKQIRFQADMKLAEMEKAEILEVKDFDLEKAKALVKKIADMKSAHHQEMLQLMHEVRGIFTEDQFKRLQALKPVKPGSKKPARMMKHRR